MALNRNQLIQALVDRLSTIPGLKTVSRVPRDVAPEDTPAMFIRAGSQRADNAGLRTVWHLNLVADLYVFADTSEGAEPVLMDLIDQVEARLQADPLEQHAPYTSATSLDGLVQHCRVDGEFDVLVGGTGKAATAEIPIEIVTLA